MENEQKSETSYKLNSDNSEDSDSDDDEYVFLSSKGHITDI